MLVLSRKTGERVRIGASVVVTVLAVHNGRVRLSFDAPSHVAIDREEVRKRRQALISEDAESARMAETAGRGDAVHPSL
jgi:carbon storage regulator